MLHARGRQRKDKVDFRPSLFGKGTGPRLPDPMAKPATGPFPGDNHIAMGAELGLGTNDPKKIEVVGVPLKDAMYPFKWEPADRNT